MAAAGGSPIQPQLTITPQPLQLSSRLRREVDRLWRLRAPGVFDGELLCALEISRAKILCQQVPYSVWYAAVRSPLIAEAVPLPALGVRAVMLAEGRVLVGRRSDRVDLYRGAIELPPGGSLAAGRSPWSQLVSELREELGLSEEALRCSRYLGLIENPEVPVADLCWRVDLDACCELHPAGDEHTSLEWLEIPEALALQEPTLPSTRTLLEWVSGGR